MTLFLTGVCIALGISALCSLAEATLLSLTPTQVAGISRDNPKMGVLWSRFKGDIDRPIAAILILNTAAHTIGATVAGSAFDALYGDEWIWVFSVIFTFVMLQFTEIFPKTIGVRMNRQIAYIIGRPLAVIITALRPVIWLVHALNRVFLSGPSAKKKSRTMEEITALAGLARLSKEISPHQEKIIKSASKLSLLSAKDVMIPLEQVAVLSTQDGVADALRLGLTELHTRYPVVKDGDLNEVEGYVNFKELARLHLDGAKDAQLRSIMRPVSFTSADMPATDLLRMFIDKKIHIGIVRNEDKETLGLITLEDLVEEFLGELEDEFDRLPKHVFATAMDGWLVGGGTPVAEVAKRLELDLPAQEKNLAQWMHDRLDGVPRSGNTVATDQATFEVRRVRRGRIFEAVVFKQQRNQG